MEGNAQPHRRKKGLSGCLLALLIVVLLPVVLVGGLWLYIATPGLSYADEATAENPPNMTASERFSVDAGTQTLHMRIDKNDFLWLVGDADSPVSLAEVQEALAPYRLRIVRYGAEIAGDRLVVNAKLRALGCIGLPVQAVLTCGMENGVIAFTVESARLGTHIELPVDDILARLSMERSDLTFTVDSAEYPWLSRLKDVAAGDGVITLSFPLGAEITAPLMSSIRTIRDTAYYVQASECAPLAVALDASENGSSDYLGEAFDAALSEMELDGAKFVDFRVQSLALLTEPSANTYLAHPGIAVYAPRFVPGFSKAAVDEKRNAINALRTTRTKAFFGLYDRLVDACKSGELTLDKAGFLNTETGEPMQFHEFMENPAEYAGWYRPERMKLLFLTGVPQLALNYPEIGALKQNAGALPRRMQQKQSLRPCLLAEMTDGTQFLYYYNSMGELVTLPDDLFRGAYDALLQNEGLTVFAPLDKTAARTNYILQ